mgnify:CR=1 FL=1
MKLVLGADHGGFDLKENSDGVPYIIDINPRLTATVSLIQKAGLNLPYYGYRYKTCERKSSMSSSATTMISSGACSAI